MEVSLTQARSTLSKFLSDLESEGEPIIITRHGQPVAELVPLATTKQRKPFPFGIARHEPFFANNETWWQPMSDAEADAWIEGR